MQCDPSKIYQSPACKCNATRARSINRRHVNTNLMAAPRPHLVCDRTTRPYLYVYIIIYHFYINLPFIHTFIIKISVFQHEKSRFFKNKNKRTTPEPSAAVVVKNDEDCVKTNDEICIKNQDFTLKRMSFVPANHEVCIKNDEFCMKRQRTYQLHQSLRVAASHLQNSSMLIQNSSVLWVFDTKILVFNTKFIIFAPQPAVKIEPNSVQKYTELRPK